MCEQFVCLYARTELVYVASVSVEHRSEETVQLLLPRVNGAGHSVVAVVHGVRGPAVAPHTLRAVVSGHGQVLQEEDRKDTSEKREKGDLSGRLMNVNEGWEEQENKSMEEMKKTDSR